MVVLVSWIAAVAVALIVLTALALGLAGHLRRFLRAVEAAEADLGPTVRALRPGLADLASRPTRPAKSVMDDPIEN